MFINKETIENAKKAAPNTVEEKPEVNKDIEKKEKSSKTMAELDKEKLTKKFSKTEKGKLN